MEISESKRDHQVYQPLVSVITVVFNDVNHLERTIKSVLDQTYKNIEYIIIDGGSTDGTVDVIKKYADRLAYWVSEKDDGMFDAMNKGVSRATGEWTNIMNSGDYFYTNTVFEEIFSKDHSKSDMLYGGLIGSIDGQPVLIEPHLDVYTKAYQGQRLCQQAVFAKTVFQKKFPFDVKYRNSADGDFTAKCIKHGCVFERLSMTIYKVGSFGNSYYNWLPCRLENWKISRTHFPGLRTDFFHFYELIYAVGFRIFKRIMPKIIYNFFRNIYRKTIKTKLIQKKYGFTVLNDDK